ncbi:MAG: hypothetical protein ACREP6_05240, partial [Candidatus Binataceae bacterium]
AFVRSSRILVSVSGGLIFVRMIVPPLTRRREIDRNLSAFFRNHRASAFNRALSGLCRYFDVKRPKIEWFEYIDWGKTAGKTYEDGRIQLVHPENWKRCRIYNRERMWVQMIYHEMGHYLLWTDAERKADAFMRRMVTGLRRDARRFTLAKAGVPGTRSAARIKRRRAISGHSRIGLRGRRIARI